MTEWVTGAEILTHLHVSIPAPEDVTWAEVCAGAVNGGIGVRLVDAPFIEPPPPDLYAEIHYAAIVAGSEAYKRREAAFGITGYADLQGIAIRVARDYLDSVAPILARYATVGIA
jgi:hypothetical protein